MGLGFSRRRRRAFIGLIGWLGVWSIGTHSASAQEVASPSASAPDKTGYTLFDPTPEDKLRSFSTDRPTKSNSSYTVDAGHFQYETDLVNYAYARAGMSKARTFVALDPTLKLGLTNNVDLELNINSYETTSTRDAATGALTSHAAGFGDMYMRAKVNLFGNDGGPAALALIPYVKAPTGAGLLSNGVVEGGFLAPLHISVTDDYGLILMPEADALKDATSARRHANFVNVVDFNGPIPWIRDLTGFIEFYSATGTDRGTPPVYTADFALSYNITKTLQVDGGANVGVNQAAPKLQLYAGLSQRF